LFCAISLLPVCRDFLSRYATANAWLANAVLNLLGQDSHMTGAGVSSRRFVVTILEGCTASDLIAFVCAGMLAFSAPFWRKAAGFAICATAIALVNVARIVTVFLVGVYQPALFQTVHVGLWPGLMALATLVLGLVWIWWAARDAGGASEWVGAIPAFARRFALVFVLLGMPWPGVTGLCRDAFRGIGALAFTTPKGAREVIFESRGAHDTRIEIANRRLMNADGSGPVRDLDLDDFSVLWRPIWLVIALIAATPMPLRQRLRALCLGGACLGGYVLLTLKFVIWNESTEVSLNTLPPFWKGIAGDAQSDLLVGLGLTVPVMVWLLTAVRRSNLHATERPA
jgi:exosortase/archaeosortase family protein